MKTLYSTTILFVFTCWIGPSFSQISSKSKKAQDAYESAAKKLVNQDKPGAIAELHKAISSDPTFATAYQQLADIYRSERKYSEAIPLYQKVLEIDPNLTKLTLFGLGESMLGKGNYKEALTYLSRYAKENLSPKSRQKVNKFIKDCEFALTSTYIEPIDVIKLSSEINTQNDEYFPRLTADGKRIIFTRKSNNQENFFESIQKDSIWTNAEKLSGAINSDFFNEGAHCISPDGKYLFFTGCNRPKGLGSCDIYISKYENGTWGTPFNLGSPINTKGWEAQPAISPDGRTLYFVSNRAGGYGSSDIWKSTLDENGNWLEPQNLGPNINTPYDERSPYIHPDNKTLYFASEGWPGFGLFDLFRSQLDSSDNWSKPVNLGNPINNNYDQTAIHITMNGIVGYLASSDSTDQLDIYHVDIPKHLRPTAVAYIKGTILDAETDKPISARVSVTDTKDNKIVYVNESDYIDGQFIATLPVGANYAVHIQKKGYMLDSKQYDILDTQLKKEVFESVIRLNPIKKGISIQLNNIYFDTDSFTLLKSSESELQIVVDFLKTNPNIEIEIGGHTDNTGNKAHNQRLSENRAVAVSNALFNKGISKARINSIGYGDSKPIGDNDTPTGKQLNRRTEITIR